MAAQCCKLADIFISRCDSLWQVPDRLIEQARAMNNKSGANGKRQLAKKLSISTVIKNNTINSSNVSSGNSSNSNSNKDHQPHQNHHHHHHHHYNPTQIHITATTTTINNSSNHNNDMRLFNSKHVHKIVI